MKPHENEGPMMRPAYIEDVASYFDDIFPLRGRIMASMVDPRVSALVATIEASCAEAAEACKQLIELYSEADDEDARAGDPNDEHRLSAAQLGLKNVRRV